MTHLDDHTTVQDLMTLLSENGIDAFPEAMRILVNEAMKAERSLALWTSPAHVDVDYIQCHA